MIEIPKSKESARNSSTIRLCAIFRKRRELTGCARCQLRTTRWLFTLRPGFPAVFFVSGNDALDQRMAHHIASRKLNDRYTFDVSQHAMSFEQTRVLVRRQVDLCFVARNNRFGIDAQAGQEHEHLLCSRVLRFVEDDKSMIEGAPTHVGQRSNLDD